MFTRDSTQVGMLQDVEGYNNKLERPLTEDKECLCDCSGLSPNADGCLVAYAILIIINDVMEYSERSQDPEEW